MHAVLTFDTHSLSFSLVVICIKKEVLHFQHFSPSVCISAHVVWTIQGLALVTQVSLPAAW